MLSEIAFKQTSNNFWYGAYCEFRVIMMKDSGYINTTKMCSSGGKEYSDWLKNKSSKELIQAVETLMERDMVLENMQASSMSHNLTLEDLSRRIIGDRSFACKKVNPSKTSVEDRIISGTYCHPDLIHHIACWVSPDF